MCPQKQVHVHVGIKSKHTRSGGKLQKLYSLGTLKNLFFLKVHKGSS